MSTIVTRFAPAPTGHLHLGHVLNATVVWGVALARGGRVLLRIEDHDPTRYRAEYEASIRDDLAWLGFVPDAEAPRQSERGDRYAAVMNRLERAGLAYACTCSRKDIAAHAGDVFNEEARYAGTCRNREIDPAAHAARRVRLERSVERFDDLLLGPQEQVPSEQCGDLLARDRIGNWTYQFAVTVDDFDQGVNLVIRGEDLLVSTGRQLQLARLIGRTEPAAFLHHPLIRKDGGAKLSKSDGDTGVRELRAAGRTPAEVIALAAQCAGYDDAPSAIAAVVNARS